MVLASNEVHDGVCANVLLTLKCIRGGPLGPMILFFASPAKTRKDFFRTIGYTSFGEKKMILMLISINEHYCTMSQNLFLLPFLN